MRDKVPHHGRIKEKYRKNPNAEEQRYWDHERDKGCLVCGRPPSIHHVTTKDGYNRLPRNHYRVTPLCYDHHQGNAGFHKLGHTRFIKEYGIDLYKEALQNITEYCDSQGLDFPNSLAQCNSIG